MHLLPCAGKIEVYLKDANHRDKLLQKVRVKVESEQREIHKSKFRSISKSNSDLANDEAYKKKIEEVVNKRFAHYLRTELNLPTKLSKEDILNLNQRRNNLTDSDKKKQADIRQEEMLCQSIK